jgi:hypothetical protein
MAFVLLALVLFGFAPTLYLRPAFPVPPIPAYLYVHGTVLTAWFVWLALQSSLVRTGRIELHRSLGVAGAAIAAGVVLVGPMATFGLVPRVIGAGVTWDTDMSALLGPAMAGVTTLNFITGVVWGNLISIAVFALLIGMAVALRRRSDWHRRLMLLGSIAIIAPALARISRLPHLGGENGPLTVVLFATLVLAVAGHDLLATRRLHHATLLGLGLILVGLIAQQAISASSWGQTFVKSLG